MGAPSAPELCGAVAGGQQLVHIPDDARTKGWLFRAVLDEVQARGLELQAPEYADFKDYPTREHVDLLGRAAALMNDEDPQVALERLGAATFPVFAGSLFGKTILEGIDRSDQKVMAALTMAPRIYAWMTAGRAQLEVSEREPARVVLRMRRVWSFPCSYQVGLLGAAAVRLGVSARMSATELEPGGAELRIAW